MQHRSATKPVLLGICDEEISDKWQPSFENNQLGGKPVWIVNTRENPMCKVCSHQMSLVIQVYCPLEGKPYHRTLYVFACCKQPCWNKPESWCVLRGQILDESYKPESPTTPSLSCTDKTENVFSLDDDWGCDNSDDWGVQHLTSSDKCLESNRSSADLNEEIPDASTSFPSQSNASIVDNADNPIVKEMNNLTLSETDEDCASDMDSAAADMCAAEDIVMQPQSDILKQLMTEQSPTESKACHRTPDSNVEFKGYYISVVDEPDSADLFLQHEEKLLREYSGRDVLEVEEYKKKPKKGGNSEGYEKSSAKHGDKYFHKFHKRISLYPQQILRYSWGGDALYLTSPCVTRIPGCEVCGANRVFELQLLPSIITFLKAKSKSGDAIEFGTVMVYTCSKSCWKDDSSDYYKETIVLQSDSDLSFLSAP